MSYQPKISGRSSKNIASPNKIVYQIQEHQAQPSKETKTTSETIKLEYML